MKPDALLTLASHFEVCLLNFFPCIHKAKPLFNQRIVLNRKTSEGIAAYPRLKMVINGSDTTGENTFPASLFQLSFENIKASVGLSCVSFECVVIFLRVKVPGKLVNAILQDSLMISMNHIPEPVGLSHHRAQG